MGDNNPLFSVAALALYLLPALIAGARGVARVWLVFLVNFFTGWTVIGWVAALGMALGDTVRLCPFCAETVKTIALVCPHCQRELEPLEVKPPPAYS